ncbi:hypothetical protein MINTMi198_27710 [Mycobacterium intracellulare M.i.198]|nr:hypothetical protein MINTM007_27490 [Mycobacterium intracellulare]BCP37401.1 hypothetical protein MINTMi198_27710 [Mycobacterium intracellulare M.i.198]
MRRTYRTPGVRLAAQSGASVRPAAHSGDRGPAQASAAGPNSTRSSISRWMSVVFIPSTFRQISTVSCPG